MNYNLTYDDLENRLKDEINLLIDLCYQFDLGKYDYANVIATKIGSIINFNNKDSILPNMNKQNEMAFWSTAKVLEFTDDVLFFRSLVAVSSNKNEMRYYPKFNHGKYLPAWVTFNKWAKSPVFILNSEENSSQFDGLIYIQEINENTQFILTRKDIINFFRNKYGGAHQDKKIEQHKYLISAGISSIEFVDHPDNRLIVGEKYKAGEPIKFLFEMAIRQIAHELILSIKNTFDFEVRYKPNYRHYVNKRPKNLLDHKITILEEFENGQKQIKIDEI